MARRRSRRTRVLVRPRPSVCRWPASRHRHRRLERDGGSRAVGRHGDVCRNRSEQRQDDLDRDAVGIHRDVAASRLDRRFTKRTCRRRSGRRNVRHRFVRLLRPAIDAEPAGIRRSAGVPSRTDGRDAADRRHGHRVAAGRGPRPRRRRRNRRSHDRRGRGAGRPAGSAGCADAERKRRLLDPRDDTRRRRARSVVGAAGVGAGRPHELTCRRRPLVGRYRRAGQRERCRSLDRRGRIRRR